MKPTQEQVIAWAREAQMSVKEPSWGYSDEYSFAGFEKTFMRFAALAYEAGRKDENEACAKVLDEMADDMVREMEPSTAIAYVRSKAAEIRSRMNP